MTNPLLDFTDLPLFDQVQPQHVAPAIDSLLLAADKALETVTQPEFPSRWHDIATVLDTAARAAASGLDDLGSATILSEIMAMRHETHYSRLFRA